MTSNVTFESIDAANSTHIQEVVTLWNSACGEDLAVSPRLVANLLRPSPGGDQTACMARVDGRPVGFVAASYLNDPTVTARPSGWIDALVVAPEDQGKGIGTALLRWAEAWHSKKGAQKLTVGAGLRPFVPGVPEELKSAGFFQRHGYGVKPEWVSQQWDVAANLATYAPPRTVREIEGLVRPAQSRDYEAILAFLQREFPDHWRYNFERDMAEGTRISDFMLLWTERGVDGYCMLTFEDSHNPIEGFYPYRLPRPWGQLGSIGVSKDRRGQGFGAALLDAGLRRLHNNGVNGCIIDWTDLLDFYAKFGFTPFRGYQILSKAP